MKNFLTFLVCLSTFSLIAQDNLPQSSIKGMYDYNSGQIISLAEAIPSEKYDWSPGEGVRSIGESLLHVAQANYFFMTKMGFELPEGVDMMTMGSTSGKDDIVKVLKNSVEFVKDKIDMVETGTLGDAVEMPFGEFTRMSTLLLILEHNGEHKGQLIAYARSNGIAPPWSE